MYSDYETYNHWLGNRISEIMSVKKKKKSHFAQEIGIERTTLGRILEGERSASTNEVRRIADGLGVAMDRLRQLDVKEEFEELQSLLTTGSLLQKSFTLASSLLMVAVGNSEKAEMNRLVGVTLQHMKRLNEAQAHLNKALEFSLLTNNRKLICRVVTTYINNMYEYGNYESVCSLVEDYGHYFEDDPVGSGSLLQFKGLCLYHRGDIIGARKEYKSSIEVFQDIGENVRCGVILVNLADMEFEEKNYIKSKEYLHTALSKLSQNKMYESIANKDLARTYLGLNQKDEALSIINKQIELDNKFKIDNPENHAKLLYMKAGIVKEPAFAEDALSLSGISKKIKKSILDFLIQLYLEQQDLQKVSKYYSMLVSSLDDALVSFTKI